MQLEDFLESVKDMPSYKLERELNSLVRKNHRFKNLSSDNREVVLELIKKYKDKIRRGLGISSYLINKEMYSLHQNRHEDDLTKRDRDQIRMILESFKK
jgi:hypothetical protein